MSASAQSDAAGAGPLLPGHSARCATQLARGFRSLRFSPELEPRFRQYRRQMNPAQLPRVLLGALLLTGILTLADYLWLSATLFTQLLLPRGLQLAALAAVAGTLLRRRPAPRYAVLITLLVYGLTTSICLALVPVGSEFAPPGALLITLLCIYFLAGLPFYQALLAGLLCSLAYLLGQLWSAPPWPWLAAHCYLLLAFNGAGLLGVWLLEYRTRENYLEQQLLSELALFDDLTGLLNRRAFALHLDNICRQARREGLGLAVAMADIDHFKQFNDRFGHLQGDQCLRAIGAAIQACSQRPLDQAGRYGGDEFILVWYDCPAAAALALADKVRRTVAGLALAPEHSPAGDRVARSAGTVANIGISIGIATGRGDALADSSTLLRHADRALYRAKAAGRGQVVLY